MKNVVITLFFLTTMFIPTSMCASSDRIVISNGTTQLLAYEENGWEIVDYVPAYNSNGHFILHIQLAEKRVNGTLYIKVRSYSSSDWCKVYRGSYICGDRKCNFSFIDENGYTYYFKY